MEDTLMKRLPIVIILCGVLLLIVGGILPFVAMINADIQSPSVGIIGGADGPTAVLVTRSIISPVSIMLSLGGALLLNGLIFLIFRRTVKENCSVKTSAAAIGLLASTILAFYSMLSLLSCFFLSDPKDHPVRFPFSMVVAVVAFLALCGLLYLYVSLRRKKASFKGVLIDIITSALYMPAFFSVCMEIDRIFSTLI